jgi:hypothetical protein
MEGAILTSGPRRPLLHELRSRPTIALVLFCLLVGLPVTILLVPGQDVLAFGQHIIVGARPPVPDLRGPARLVQVGNTAIDLEPLQVWGPLRPQLTMGPVQRNAAAAAVFDPQAGPAAAGAAVAAVTHGFVRWYLLGLLGVVVFALVAAAAAAGIRTLLVVRRQSRAGADQAPLAEIWAYCVRAAGRMTVIASVVSVLAWGACGVLAYSGTAQGLRGVTSLPQLVGAYHVSPDPVGPLVSGFTGAVIGDSRAARIGGPPVATAADPGRPDDAVCERSTDSMAAEIGHLMPGNVVNLACPDATVTSGLVGPQQRGGTEVPAQVGLLKQLQGLKFVVVVIGPNDVGWSDFLRYCYGVADCNDQLTEGEFGLRLAAFDRAFGDLLVDLNDLPGRPQVIVTTSYDVFPATAEQRTPDCPDLRFGSFPGLDQGKIDLFAARNAALNAVLDGGAAKYGFAVARPELLPLCSTAADPLGPDIQGIDSPDAFHPTGVGSLRMASAVVRLIAPNAAR